MYANLVLHIKLPVTGFPVLFRTLHRELRFFKLTPLMWTQESDSRSVTKEKSLKENKNHSMKSNLRIGLEEK